MHSAEHSAQAVSSAARPSPAAFRFSLLTLLSVTTLAGLVSAIVFSKHWHPDERLLLAFWCAGLILGVSVGRQRGTSGVVSGGAGAVLGSLLAAMLVLNDWQITSPVVSEAEVSSYIAFVVGVSWFTAMLAAVTYRALSAGWVERIWQHRGSCRVLLIAGGCVFVFVTTAQMLRPQRWQPTWQIDLRGKYWADPAYQISPQGEFLFTSAPGLAPSGTESSSCLYQFTRAGVTKRELAKSYATLRSELSADGNWLVSVGVSDVTLLDLRTSEVFRNWKLKDIETISHLRFSDSSERLLLTTHTPRIQRLYDIDLSSDELPRPQLFPFAGTLYLDPTGEVLLKVHDPIDENDERIVEVVRRSDESLLGQFRDVPLYPAHAPAIAPGGEYLAYDMRVWPTAGGPAVLFSGQVIGFTADRRAIVFVLHHKNAAPALLPDWLLKMPFVRHLRESEAGGELQVVDLESGECLARTGRIADMLQANCSQQGTVVIGVTLPNAHFRIWKVPERK